MKLKAQKSLKLKGVWIDEASKGLRRHDMITITGFYSDLCVSMQTA